MKNLIKQIKKLNLKKDNILVITLKGQPDFFQLDELKQKLLKMPIKKKVYCLIVGENIDVTMQKLNKGKHQVYLNNLEYLDYLYKKANEQRIKAKA